MTFMVRVTISFLVVLVSLTLTGCGTMEARQYPSCRIEEGIVQEDLYPATACDLRIFKEVGKMKLGRHSPGDNDIACCFFPFALFDLPLALVTDTLLLPLDLARHSSNKKHKDLKSRPEPHTADDLIWRMNRKADDF